jgi:hypothetical protein
MAFSDSSIEELYLPASLEVFSDIIFSPIHTVVIADGSKYYKTVDGVVYTADGETLVYYPQEKKDKEYTVLDGTKKIVTFSYNSHIERINLPSSIKELKSMNMLTNLHTMSLPEGLETIGQIIGNKLTEIIIPNSVKRLEGQNFASCEMLTRVVLPDDLEYIGYDAFIGCSVLKAIEISENNKNYCVADGVLYSKNMTELVIYPFGKPDEVFVIPEGVESAANGVFAANTNIKELVLPSTLKKLPRSFIDGSAVTKINLNYVEELSGGTFASCMGLSVIVLSENVKKIGDQEFLYTYASVVIENKDMEVDPDCFLGADNVIVFLGYDGIGEKEELWIPYVSAVYERSEWEYVNGIPTPKK